MKRLALACSVVVVTFLLGIVAVSVAQRDARNREAVPIVRPDYAMQSPEPFRASIAGDDESIESDSSAPPLDVPPPLSRNLIVRGNDEEVNTDSPVVLASDNQLISPPSLTPTPLPSGFSPPPLGSNLQPPSYSGGNNAPTTNSPISNTPAISQPRIGSPTASSSRLSDSGPSSSLASPPSYSPTNNSAIASPPSGFGQPSSLSSTPISGQSAAPGQVGSLSQPSNLSSPPNANSPKTSLPAYGSIASPLDRQGKTFLHLHRLIRRLASPTIDLQQLRAPVWNASLRRKSIEVLRLTLPHNRMAFRIEILRTCGRHRAVLRLATTLHCNLAIHAAGQLETWVPTSLN